MIYFKNYLNKQILNIRKKYYKYFYELPSTELELLTDSNEFETDSIIKDNICMPPYLGTDECDDMFALLKIIKYFKPKILLEFGTAHGNTVANICKHDSNCRVYTVNALINQLSGNVVTYGNLTKDEIGCVYRKYGFSDRVVQIYQNTLEIDLELFFEQSRIDIAIIDACHDTEFVINDFLKVEPYIRKNGLILLHDTHPSMQNHLFGSYFGCMKLRKIGFDIRYLKNTWWGFYIKN